MSRDEYYLGIALAVSKKSPCLKKHYGAIIVKNNEIIATGYNGPPRGVPHCTTCSKESGNGDMEEYMSCPAVHAEMNAIISAARRDMIGAELYLACEGVQNPQPCKICSRLIQNAGIKKIITSKETSYEYY